MPALEILTGIVTAPDTTLTALTMQSNDSLTIRNAPDSASVLLLSAWTDNQTAGILRIKSPQMHDNTQGIRLTAFASTVRPLLPTTFPVALVPVDTLSVDLSGSATAADIETACLLVYYSELPGISARLIDAAAVAQGYKTLVTVENTLALGTSGGYSGSELINAEYDLLKAETDYAILGYVVSAECAAICYNGTDFGNLRLGGPGNPDEPQQTAKFFVDLSLQTGLPTVPVFNSGNKAGTFISGVQDENGTDVTVHTILAEMS